MTNQPRITDPCPSCGAAGLFIGIGGYLTCSALGCKNPCVGREIASIKAELARLTKSLHAVRQHPDFSYQVVPSSDNLLTPSGGWELNPEWAGNGVDLCWRRKRETR